MRLDEWSELLASQLDKERKELSENPRHQIDEDYIQMMYALRHITDTRFRLRDAPAQELLEECQNTAYRSLYDLGRWWREAE